MGHELEDRYVEDGVYCVSEDTVVYEISDRRVERYELTLAHPEVAEFAAKYPGFVVASAYETRTILLLSKMPDPFTGSSVGSGFNYGSTNFLEGCSSRMLILAQND